MTQESFRIAIISIVCFSALIFLFCLVECRFNIFRVLLLLKTEWHLVTDGAFAKRVAGLFGTPAEEEKAKKPTAEPLRLLALLQREGRLVDFLLEDIQNYDDAQVGAAVRDIQQKCQTALREHVVMQPVLNKTEGEVVEIPAGFDPSAIRLTGNLTGKPPFRGVLRHHGWRVQKLDLAPPPSGQDEFVVSPAEVELN
ncbi:MAG TPA: DUF2760 domain-containing protein [Gemmataceae bacterium]|nr:DUF2760 domain-containing protein [Gemmataceae bacterium]